MLYDNSELVDLKNSPDDVRFEKCFLIETHSEYFLRRLRRRMAEGVKINPNLVNIYFVHGRKNGEGGSRLEKIEIGEHGAFDWPEEYYSDEIEDTIEFIKNQVK